jgi:hypothetical protein
VHRIPHPGSADLLETKFQAETLSYILVQTKNIRNFSMLRTMRSTATAQAATNLETDLGPEDSNVELQDAETADTSNPRERSRKAGRTKFWDDYQAHGVLEEDGTITRPDHLWILFNLRGQTARLWSRTLDDVQPESGPRGQRHAVYLSGLDTHAIPLLGRLDPRGRQCLLGLLGAIPVDAKMEDFLLHHDQPTLASLNGATYVYPW